MVYNNFILRLLFSFLFIFIYLFISLINFGLVFYLILAVYILVLFEIFLYFKKFKLLPIIYIIISLLFFINIDFSITNYYYFNLFICIVILFDIFCYIIGRTFGKKKLIKISPNKTIEGFIGGFIISFLLNLLIAFIFNINIDVHLSVFIILSIGFAFIGDLIESFFKRKNNLKDSSDLIPGHGGVFDRFDSFLFAIIFYSVFITFLK